MKMSLSTLTAMDSYRQPTSLARVAFETTVALGGS